jgi:hypothetical protein
LCWDIGATGGADEVGDTGATRGTGVVVVIAWGATEVMGATQGTMEVDEEHDQEAMKNRAVGPPGVEV